MLNVCLTTYPARVANVPRVLDSLRTQTILPDRFVITLCKADEHLRHMFDNMPDVKVLIVRDDTKVWKKFLPAMDALHMKHDDLVLTVDDDKLYPPQMIADFMWAHNEYPDAPISGNHYWHNGLKCHCGGCSLVQPRHMAGWQKYYAYWRQLPSDDMFYTMLAARNHFAYMQTATNWERKATPYNEVQPYSAHGMVQQTYLRTAKLFGWI